MSMLILQGLGSMVSASRRDNPHLSIRAPRAARVTPTSPSSACRSPGPWELSVGSKEVLPTSVISASAEQPHSMAQRKLQLSYVLIQNTLSSTVMGYLGLPGWVALMSPRRTVLYLLSFPETPPPAHAGHSIGVQRAPRSLQGRAHCSVAIIGTHVLPRSPPVPPLQVG